jgi:hypothetical protein
MSSTGPVLIDWTNAARGAGAADVALTRLLLTAAEIPGGWTPATIGGAFRRLFVRLFLGHFDRGPVRAVLPTVLEWKRQDRNMRPAEVAAMMRLVATEAGQL